MQPVAAPDDSSPGAQHLLGMLAGSLGFYIIKRGVFSFLLREEGGYISMSWSETVVGIQVDQYAHVYFNRIYLGSASFLGLSAGPR
jgi:hypothetical protein